MLVINNVNNEATMTGPCYKVEVGVRAGIGSSEARQLVQPVAEPG